MLGLCFVSDKLHGKDACFEEFTKLAKLHNKKLSKALPMLGKKLKGFIYSYTDLYNAFTGILNNPEKYGFREEKVVCCGSGPFRGIDSCGGRRGIKEYEFFDSSHPTEKANKLFAKLLWSGNSNITRPMNLKALFHV